MKFKVYKNLNYVMGHLRYGHFEGIIEAKDEEELKKMFKEDEDFLWDSLNLVIDDYEIDDYELSSEPYKYRVVEELNNDMLDE